MSNELTPSLANVLPVFELFMTALDELGEKFPILKPITDAGVEGASIYYKRMDSSPAYVLAMCKLLQFGLSTVLTSLHISLQPNVSFCLD